MATVLGNFEQTTRRAVFAASIAHRECSLSLPALPRCAAAALPALRQSSLCLRHFAIASLQRPRQPRLLQGGRKKVTRKYKILKCHNLKFECFIDDAWHPATIQHGENGLYLLGLTYWIVYDKDGYQESRVCDNTMRIAV